MNILPLSFEKKTSMLLIKFILLSCIIISSGVPIKAQEQYGNTLNIGVGVGGYSGYYRYTGRTVPVFHLDYEFDVAKNFTLAPFISIHSHTRTHYWGNPNHGFYNYQYRETAIPIGMKGFLYMDSWFDAGEKWDFYLGGSIGVVAVFGRWDSGYNGDRNVYRAPWLFLDVHAGVEYHINDRVGVYLDLSTGVSTFGLAIHGIKK